VTVHGNPRADVGGPRRAGRLTLPGIVLGVGMGGFVDGIVLHQILQWHHLLTSTDTDNIGVPYYPADTVPGLEVNTLWDGLFHATTWVFVVAGLWLLQRAWRGASVPRAWRALLGLLLAGWGLFNLVEGVVDHHLLGIHHVREGAGRLWWDLAFLAFGALLLVGGWALYRSALRREGALV
jgi:uncharacterized membrane protein